MVCSQMPPVYGGAGAQAVLLGRTLNQMGWEVEAVTLDQEGVGSGIEQGIKLHRLLHGVTPTNGWTRLATTLGLSIVSFLRIATSRPSIVHIHGAYWWSILPAVAGQLAGAKVIVKLTRDGEDDAKTVYSKRVGRISVGRIYGLSLTLADAVIVLNERARNVAESEGLGKRIRLISNGVDEALLTRTPQRRAQARTATSLKADDRVVIFVGYLVKHKGVIDLLEAWRANEDRGTHLWLVGPFGGFYRELDDQIPQLVEELVRDGYRVKTLGHLPGAELPALYWAADVFTLPSYAEGMPNSLAEALVAGCHVVATRIPGITDLMGANSPDLVEPGDVSTLAKLLAAAIHSPSQAPEELIHRLHIDHVAEIYQQLYLELVSVTHS